MKAVRVPGNAFMPVLWENYAPANDRNVMYFGRRDVANTANATGLSVHDARGRGDVAVGARTLPLRSAQGALDRVRSLRGAGELPKGEVVRICFGDGLEDGPSIRFEGGMAKFAGEVCPLSKDGWTTVVMEIDIDRRDWSVSLAPDGEPRRGFGPFEMPKDFRRLDWIGFTTDSENDSSWYLDDFKYTIK